MNLHQLKERRLSIMATAALHGARNLKVFGSIARGTADDSSDIDFLVELEPGRSLLDLGGLQVALQRLLGKPVDVITVPGLKERIRDRVLREAVPL